MISFSLFLLIFLFVEEPEDFPGLEAAGISFGIHGTGL